ncbi:MAG: SurA N-terminal domain-containing protein [Betaproteobacteria bacterium]|nr:SurA N-terminal domain-containing protein [Betaproteobacteria bacterium]
MFDIVHGHKRAVQIVLALIILPFAFWGVESYRRVGDSNFVASVGDDEISVQEFEAALKDQQDRLRTLMGRNFDPALFERPEFRLSLVENLVRQRLLSREAVGAGLAVSDVQLASIIQQIAAFQQDGRFSKQRYENVLRNQGMTPLNFEARLKQELAVQQLTDAYAQNTFLPAAVIDRIIRLNEQQREVSVAHIAPDSYLARVKVEPTEAKAYYDGHLPEFGVPEQVRIEYLTLSADSLLGQVQVTPEELTKYYEEREKEFGKAEERQASHILITAGQGASEADRAAALKKAEDLLRQVRQAPNKFAELAKQHSQDPGSAANGGDLGYFARGAMVKPFEDAVFQMKPNEILGPVQSDFGYHVIKLTGIRPGKVAGFDEVKDRIEQEVRKQKAGKKFAEAAEGFSNMVFEQGESLKPAAEAFKLPIQQSSWLSRAGGEVAFPGNEKMLAAVFSEDVLKNKRNTEAIEVAPNTLVSARVIEHRPASTRPFDEVKADVTRRLARQKAGELALKEGGEKLAALAEGKDPGVGWSKPVTVSRQQAPGMPEAIYGKVFGASPAKLPAYVGAENPQGGYILARVSRVAEVASIDDVKRRAYAQQVRQMLGQEELGAYVASLRKKTEVKIRQELLEKK